MRCKKISRFLAAVTEQRKKWKLSTEMGILKVREVGVIEDISPNEKEVISIINKLKEHYVTPIVMKDIIDDMKYEISPTIITTRT